MTAQKSFIGIDIGTSFIKGAVLDLEQRALGQQRRQPFPGPVSGLPPLFYEVDANAVVSTVRSLIAQLLPYAANCAGVVMCGQMGGLVLTNQQGDALSSYISWLDKRVLGPHPSGNGAYFEVLSEQLSASERRQLGQEVRPGLLLSTLFWLNETQQLPRGVIPATLPDFVLANLCHTAPTIDPTHATGAINLETGDWHHDVFAKLGLDRLDLPPIRDFRTSVGQMTIDSKSLPCYTAVGDHQCALAGIAIDFRELSLNVSTGSQVSLLTAQLTPGNYQTRPFFDGHFLNTITNIPAGRALNVLLNLLSELATAQQIDLPDPWPYITQAVEAVPETDLSVDLAFFPSPMGDRGAISNIREDNLTLGHLFRAAFQRMAADYDTCAQRLSPAKSWQRIVFSGGLAQNLAALREHILSNLQADYRLCASTEDTMLGLLALALVINAQASTVAQAGALLRLSPKKAYVF